MYNFLCKQATCRLILKSLIYRTSLKSFPSIQFPIIITETEFIYISLEVFLACMVVYSSKTTLQYAPKSFDIVCISIAIYILSVTVFNNIMLV